MLKCTATVPLNYENIRKKFTKNIKTQALKSKAAKNEWKNFQKNNSKLDVNILYVKKIDIYLAYFTKHSSNHEKKKQGQNMMAGFIF